ncbi:MAG: YkgJ family cysteine cluster protein [Candidatus Omnitrophota bacterium]
MIELEQLLTQEDCSACDGCCRYAERESVWTPLFLFDEIVELTEGNIVPTCLFTHSAWRQKAAARIDLVQDEGRFFCSCFDVAQNKCKIYPHRPLDCRLYPFVLARKDKKIYLALDEKCPGAQRRSGTKEMKDYIQYLVKFFASKKTEDLLKRDPEFVQEYPSGLKFLISLWNYSPSP